jgi:GxxExxY protein
MKTQKEIFQLCDQIRETAFALHRYLRHGHLEKVYENGLANRLRKAGIQVEQQHALRVLDEDGTVLGDYFADLFVCGDLIVELKAARPSPMNMSRSFLDICAVPGLNMGC